MTFDGRQDSIRIEINFALPPDFLHDERPGASLYNIFELAARKAGIRMITLSSAPERVGYWEMPGFRASGPSCEGDFCTLYPMEKYL